MGETPRHESVAGEALPQPAEHATAGSAWRPLGHTLFRVLWIATVVSNLGTWMHNVGAAWLMTSLTPSPMMVALVQAATSVPVVLVGLPAGALADIVDRRLLLLWTQGWMLAAAAALGGLTLMGGTTPWVLLTLTFALGLGAAMNAPAWQAIVPDLVPQAELSAAVALNSVGFNLARAVGPALGGLMIAAAGTSAVFLLNAASFLGVVVVLARWQRLSRASVLPSEHMWGAIRAGMRYVRHAPTLDAVLLHAGSFILCGAALWALLPLVAQHALGLGATGYGVLVGCLGLGAVVGAVLLPSLQRKVAINTLTAAATGLFAAVTLLLASVQHFGLLSATMMAGGLAWTILMSTFTVAVQTAVPAWVRARALGVYTLVVQGGMAVGSAVWGGVASHTGLPIAFLGAACGLILGLIALGRYRLQPTDGLDMTQTLPWHDPVVVRPARPDDGPVLVLLEYSIAPEQASAFTRAMRALCVVRRRDGAMRWGLFGDTAQLDRYVETFLVESWAEHLRQHERMTVRDRAVRDQAYAFHLGDGPPRVSHFISAYAWEDEHARKP
jgi:MFS family permease